MNLSSLIDQAKDSFYALTSCCCATDTTLKLNGRSFRIQKLLGEGGFSYVYLAQDLASSRLFALKKIRCPLGSDSVRAALKEVEAYKRFRHPNIIRCLDSCVVQDGEGKVIYLFLPYYQNGTVQNIIASNAVNSIPFPEKQMLLLFLSTCSAVAAMHLYTSTSSSSSTASSYPPQPIPSPSGSPRMTGGGGAGGVGGALGGTPDGPGEETTDEDDDEEGLVVHGGDGAGEGERLIGGLEGIKAELEEEEGERRIAGMGEDGGVVLGRLGKGKGREEDEGGVPDGAVKEDDGTPKLIPWAHRDIKPANVMILDDGVTPILMDFGSALPARIPIPNRNIALTQQDIAAEHCSMPFRAPELFDVKTGQDLTEAVDIWSLGCTLYCMAYGTSPFETTQQLDHGGSIAMAVQNGKYTFPASLESTYTEGFRDLIRCMLVLDPRERPAILEVMDKTKVALARLE